MADIRGVVRPTAKIACPNKKICILLKFTFGSALVLTHIHLYSGEEAASHAQRL